MAAESVRESRNLHDTSSLGEANRQFPPNAPDVGAVAVKAEAKPTGACAVAARVGVERSPSLPKTQFKVDDAATKPGFDIQIPDWALSELKTPQQSISRLVGSTRKRPWRVADVAQDIDLPRRAPLVTVRQAAELLNVSPKTIRRLIARGEFAAVRIGRSVRIRPEELERLA